MFEFVRKGLPLKFPVPGLTPDFAVSLSDVIYHCSNDFDLLCLRCLLLMHWRHISVGCKYKDECVGVSASAWLLL